MNNFIDKIQHVNNVSVFITKNDHEILAFNGIIEEIRIDSELVNIDLNVCEITINRSWGIIVEDDKNYILNCGDNVYLYIDILD